MGNKVHPRGFRIGVTQGWDSLWFADSKNYVKLLQEDVMIRAHLMKTLKDALIDKVEIERTRQEIKITIYSAKPGIIIGRGGTGIEDLSKKIKTKFFAGKRVKLSINVKEVQNASLSSQVVGQQIAADIEKRMPFRRVMKGTLERVTKAGAKGVKVVISGRLNGSEIARREMLAQGKIPLHTLRSDIDYASVTARTIWGAIGIKVWINRGEVFDKKA
ncbi:30S ribosomal protein S3 [Candidatus Uhrbacteria bacterium RIFCSPHIGHO2_02_FULL_47_44]|uniref:Small ribosomal subunit protein uS3 n=1 Tax=Candidatus Uhrbacteria bacterium RIFCSPLOWO2_02_FULL_48_18 TaxID=1802408 RepID=A0A1F7V975_9BACT|nr:MAG: 30S ribosomal protein S3 [Candidatus Uhrbacteria bacterium RIFCSPHIGHO2_01_FULL_47_10]OGL70954.1 MAG: 30S ribosomal protein S3 [Candidatus Uhrbacteria bacterium RIFCSPHIGHO2_02_FULL_47_44]OGL76946.1 MAG: 30S ribosomal protein S3 [Candidatus Uhrbacteria bacterium RIFCSPHIGHO2_12_FULL_47_12]OGL80721.1 MAG: 30S ribosomal protein S3 [Candidatus Uhrbacteria bacterium RIFCSPLOWO2_01_FULL_47_17]OGL86627.1 MAG: 30S ribosomal protein S3 [Candidatus Uhrbacteria bacterium RIFCSPLOWO2_02_FULL_48_18